MSEVLPFSITSQLVEEEWQSLLSFLTTFDSMMSQMIVL